MATPGLGLAALLLIVPALAKEQPISAVVNNAKYVMVTSPSGDIFSLDISAEDRQAVKQVQAAIENWGRYKLVYKRQEADLILLVRTGRTASVEGGVQVGTHSGSNRVSGKSIGVEAGNPEDTLELYPTSQREGSPLWRGSEPQGLTPHK